MFPLLGRRIVSKDVFFCGARRLFARSSQQTQTRKLCMPTTITGTRTLLSPTLLSWRTCPCSIHTTPTRFNPIVSTIVRQVVKVVTIFTGRAIRNWWRSLPDNKRQAFLAWLRKHKWKLSLPFLTLLISFVGYYLTHIEPTPITGRQRFIAFTTEQFKLLNQMELDAQLAQFKTKLLASNHPITRRVALVAKQLLDRNQDIQSIKQHEWTVSVIDDPSTMNAFVLASGNIFVFSGLLHICENDSQLGVVLSHEMSHAILQHGVEMASHAHIVDMIFIGLIGFIWMLLPTDLIAATGTALSRFVLRIMFDTPYSKMLEQEADEVGLQLAAKACFDVREAAAFWKKMEIIEDARTGQIGLPGGDAKIQLEFLATHPSHEKRWEHLNSIMEKAVQCRKDKGCPALPRVDPREKIEILKNSLMADVKKEKFEGVLRLNELK